MVNYEWGKIHTVTVQQAVHSKRWCNVILYIISCHIIPIYQDTRYKKKNIEFHPLAPTHYDWPIVPSSVEMQVKKGEASSISGCIAYSCDACSAVI